MKKNTSSISYFPYFHDVTEHFASRFDKMGRQWAFHGKTRKEALAWQRKLRAKVASLIGLDAFDRSPSRAKLHGREDMGTYWRENWTMHTEPDVIAPFYALVPKGIKRGERRPVVLCPHGHGSAGRFSPAGRRDIRSVAGAVKLYNYDYAVKLAERGCVTFAMDSRGFGQRRVQDRQEDKKNKKLFLKESCHELMLMGYPLGQTVIGMWVWDLMRLVDHIETRSDCNPRQIGCAGLSGGGYQTLYLAALDPRIKAAVVSGYFYGVKDSLIRLANNCDCNCVPHLWEYADMGDIGGLIAPRALFIETGDKDELNGKARRLENVHSQMRHARKAYKALGSEAELAHHIFKGGHRWNGEKSEPWLVEKLTGIDASSKCKSL